MVKFRGEALTPFQELSKHECPLLLSSVERSNPYNGSEKPFHSFPSTTHCHIQFLKTYTELYFKNSETVQPEKSSSIASHTQLLVRQDNNCLPRSYNYSLSYRAHSSIPIVSEAGEAKLAATHIQIIK